MQQFDPLSPDFRANPYPYYDMLRAAMPVFYLPDWNIWFCTRYDDCVRLMRDNRLGHEILNVMSREELGWELPEDVSAERRKLGEIQRNWMLFRDPPDHRRLRGLVHQAFTPRMIERLRDHIEAITTQLLDAVQDKGEMDIINDFAIPLPVTVIAEMLGIPLEDQAMFRAWSHNLAGTLDLIDNPETMDRAAAVIGDFDAYLRDLARQRRQDPQEDLITALVEAEEAGDKLSEDELISTVSLLLIAGHETTVNLIGNGTLALMRNRNQWDKLKADLSPEAVTTAVEELLRYDSPVQMTTRWILEDIQHGEHLLKKGQQVGIMFAAANRDPERFANPGELDITRQDNKHLAFGHGLHYCLGANLARLEAQTAFRALAQRMPDLQLATGEPTYRKTYILRGLESLHVTF